MNNSEKDVKISKAKGRPMLTWVGKKPLERVKAYPAQHIETFAVKDAPKDALAECDWSDWPEKFPRGGLLFHGDNKDVLAYLLANGFRGKVKLIYIDPPFDSGADYVRKVELRGKQKTAKVEGEDYTLGEQIQYTDIWANDNYLQFMYERLALLKELLSSDGALWVHCDHRVMHYLRLLLEELFGEQNFLNTISWRSQVARGAKVNAFYLPFSTQYIHAFGKNKEAPTKYHIQKKELIYTEKQAAQEYLKDEGGYFRTSDPGSYSYDKLLELNGEGRLYAPYGGRVVVDERSKRIYTSKGGNLAVKYYLKKLADGRYAAERAIDNLWDDVPGLGTTPNEDLGFPTQKTEALLNRIVFIATDPNDIILDAFVGSGTTAAVSQKLGRRWVECDINKGAIQTTAKRLQTVMTEQAEAARKPKQKKLDENDEAEKPCQLSFTTWRVNDYDLQIQHNEAVELACEYLGVTRMRTDTYFDGTRGKELVKIVPFNHPLTPLDIEDLTAELKRRPEEERNITLVCLGMELAAKEAVDKHNRNRPINRIHVIELRTDKNYGGFIRHEPLSAKVAVKRKGDKLTVEIKDVISPTILQRLDMEQGVFRAKIPDWRAVVDCVLIDTDYDGKVFNVALADVPAKKADFVAGTYELPAPRKGATVAVKIIDMLGEETLVTANP